MIPLQDKQLRDVRVFTIGLGAIGVAAAIVVALKSASGDSIVLGVAGSVLAIVGWIRPHWARPLYRAWMAVAGVIGWIITRVVLILVYFLIVTPLALVSRVLGKRWLSTKWKEPRETFWNSRELKNRTSEEFERQF